MHKIDSTKIENPCCNKKEKSSLDETNSIFRCTGKMTENTYR